MPKSSTAWVGCTNVTDDRQTTDGRPIAYSKRNVIRWRLLKSRRISHPPESKVQCWNGYCNCQRRQRVRSACVDNVHPRRRTYLFSIYVQECSQAWAWGGGSVPKLKVSHPKQSSPFLCYQKVYRMSYRADVSKHIHVQQQEADGERELPVVLCTLNPHCLRLRPLGLAYCVVGFSGASGTELARKLLIFMCESAQNALFHTKYLKNVMWRGLSPSPDSTPSVICDESLGDWSMPRLFHWGQVARRALLRVKLLIQSLVLHRTSVAQCNHLEDIRPRGFSVCNLRLKADRPKNSFTRYQWQPASRAIVISATGGLNNLRV